MKTKLFVLCVAGFALTFASPVLGHHFFPKESDKSITLSGKVTGFEWVNPHSRFFMDVKDNAGKVTNWEIELGSPLALTRRGWTQESLRFGDVVTVDVIRWKGRANVGVARDLVFPDGRKVFAGSHAGDPVFEKP